MGRGRQKAKQQKIARKLKYLTTDTDYDELAKELRLRESSEGQEDSFTQVSNGLSKDHGDSVESVPAEGIGDQGDADVQASTSAPSVDDLDEYARWAAEAAAKATGQIPVVKKAIKPHKPIPMPVPSALKRAESSAAKPKAEESAKPETAKKSVKAAASKSAGAKKTAAKTATAKSAKASKTTKTATTTTDAAAGSKGTKTKASSRKVSGK